jgi:thioesterase domain-containing protein
VTTQEFLVELRRLDVDLWLEGDRVRCSAPPDVLTAERRAELARRKIEIEALLKAARAAAPGSIVPIETGGSRLPFYAIPGHNGDVFCFVRLARCLGSDRPFYGLQPPGLDGTEPCTTIEELATHFVRELLVHQPEGPYQLGGYCLGGLTAFEMARQLRLTGREVRALVLFGTMSPPALRPANRARAAIAQWSGDRVRGARTFAGLSGRDRVRKVREKVRASVAADEVGRDEAALADEFTARRLRVETATLAAANRYRPEPYDGVITLFVPNEAATRSLDRPLEWEGYAIGGIDVFCGPADCDGDSMLKDDAAVAFADALAARLDKLAAKAAVRVHP